MHHFCFSGNFIFLLNFLKCQWNSAVFLFFGYDALLLKIIFKYKGYIELPFNNNTKQNSWRHRISIRLPWWWLQHNVVKIFIIIKNIITMIVNRIRKLKYFNKCKKNCLISLMLNNLFGCFHFFLKRKTITE